MSPKEAGSKQRLFQPKWRTGLAFWEISGPRTQSQVDNSSICRDVTFDDRNAERVTVQQQATEIHHKPTTTQRGKKLCGTGDGGGQEKDLAGFRSLRCMFNRALRVHRPVNLWYRLRFEEASTANGPMHAAKWCSRPHRRVAKRMLRCWRLSKRKFAHWTKQSS